MYYPSIDDEIIRIGQEHHQIMLDDGSSSMPENGLSASRKKTENNTGRIKCSQCRKRFNSAEEMEMHRDMQHFHKFSCEVCCKSFATQSSLWKHVKSHNGQRPYLCDICNKGFTQLANLQRHHLVHNGLKPFQCPVCNKTFSQHANMLKHQLLHSGLKPYKCHSCDKAFVQRANLKKHEMIHNGVKPHSCPVCAKSYSQFVNLKKHLLTHAKGGKGGGKNENHHGSYECVICKATFASYDEYKPHMKVACRRRIDNVVVEVIKKEPPQLADENSMLMNSGIMMSQDGLISAAGHPIAHLHHHLHPHLPPHHQATSPSYILP